MRRFGKMFGIAVIVAISGITSLLLFSSSTSAVSGNDFSAGHIIDDSVFYNSQSMSSVQIQNFLESKNPNCDYYGTRPASDWGYPNLTHAQFAQYKREGTNGFSQDTGFHAPPYRCLTKYVQDTPQMEAASGYCAAINAGSRTAAQIINDVAKACGINPQVLVILLEKEQSLITDSWPLDRQLRNATGFACPDTAPCNPAYEGFFYQVYNAARQFQVYKKYPNSYNYVAGRNNTIYYHPGPTVNGVKQNITYCGSTQVYIQNQATAALYIYTPYQPNGAALSNLYGTGNTCSSYGNRNFWRIFNDWFGSTLGTPVIPEVATRYNALGGSGGVLGIPTANGFCNDNKSVCWQQFKNGYILYSPASGAWESKGSIREYWGVTGYQNGKLGFPVDAEFYAGNGLWWQQFQNGFIIGSGATGFWESMGSIREYWGTLGYQSSGIGLPVNKLTENSDGSAWQQFQNGFIVKAGGANTSPWESVGAIRAYWGTIGYQGGKAGWPDGPVTYDAESSTWSQKYQKGTIFYSNARGGWFIESVQP